MDVKNTCKNDKKLQKIQIVLKLFMPLLIHMIKYIFHEKKTRFLLTSLKNTHIADYKAKSHFNSDFLAFLYRIYK